MWFIKNRKGIQRVLTQDFEWPGISLHYRDKFSCIVYVSEDYSEMYIDTPDDSETISINNPIPGKHSVPQLMYALLAYIRATKVVLKNNKKARQFVNKVLKDNFVFYGKRFGEFFLDDGEIDWDLVMEVTGLDFGKIVFLINDDIDWGGYCPLRIYRKRKEEIK